MIVVNFSHPLTAQQCAQVEGLVRAPIERVIDVPVHFDDGQPFTEQVAALVERVGLTVEEWQTLPLLLNLPSYSPIVAVLLAHLHGVTGHFPVVIRPRPSPDSPLPVYEVAELLQLDRVRGEARRGR